MHNYHPAVAIIIMRHTFFVNTDLTIDVKSRSSSLQSFNILSDSLSLMYSVSYNNSSQYSDSLASFRAIFIFAPKSAFDCPRIASFTLAPILVPHRRSCFAITNSFLLSVKYLYKLIHRIANTLLLVAIRFSSVFFIFYLYLFIPNGNYALCIMH